jgi:hypothetical protein
MLWNICALRIWTVKPLFEKGLILFILLHNIELAHRMWICGIESAINGFILEFWNIGWGLYTLLVHNRLRDSFYRSLALTKLNWAPLKTLPNMWYVLLLNLWSVIWNNAETTSALEGTWGGVVCLWFISLRWAWSILHHARSIVELPVLRRVLLMKLLSAHIVRIHSRGLNMLLLLDFYFFI